MEPKPCPFCGGTDTEIKENTHWTGMRSQLISVDLRHWCNNEDDSFVSPFIKIRARTKSQAIEEWNKRNATC